MCVAYCEVGVDRAHCIRPGLRARVRAVVLDRLVQRVVDQRRQQPTRLCGASLAGMYRCIYLSVYVLLPPPNSHSLALWDIQGKGDIDTYICTSSPKFWINKRLLRGTKVANCFSNAIPWSFYAGCASWADGGLLLLLRYVPNSGASHGAPNLKRSHQQFCMIDSYRYTSPVHTVHMCLWSLHTLRRV